MGTKTPPLEYQYDPLPQERSFRLLNIFPGHDGDLRLQMSSYPLDGPPKYETLSYTWGTATRNIHPETTENSDSTYTVYIDECSILVTQNLYDVLIQLRASGFSSLIWVDAICINQNDVEERQSQVSLMGDLYANAERVVIWLGKDETNLEEFVWAHQLLWKWVERPNGILREPRDPELLKELNLTREEWDRRWVCYSRFYGTRRWFSRAWIVQELGLSRDTVVLCGKVTLSMDEMEALAFFLRGESNWSHELIENSEKQEASSDFLVLQSCRRSVQRGGPNAEIYQSYDEQERWLMFLSETLLELRTREAGVLHDKIYAGLGICNRYLAGRPSQLTPNYSQPPQEAFISATKLLLLGLPHLDILSQVEDRTVRKVNDLPSWCPDYSVGQPQYDFAHFSTLYRFCGGIKSDCQITDKTLILKGARVDSITSVSHLLDKKSASPPTKLNIMLGFCQLMDPVYKHTGQDRLEVLWRTIIADSIHQNRAEGPNYPAPAEEVERFLSWVLYWYSSIVVQIDCAGLSRTDPNGRMGFQAFLKKRDEAFKDSSVRLPNFEMADTEAALRTVTASSVDITTMPMSQAASEFQVRVQLVLVLRRFLFTSRGYFGLGSASMKEGDEVWMFQGSNVPFVLRPMQRMDGKYSLIGEAYLHGLMDGQVLDTPGFREIIGPVHIV